MKASNYKVRAEQSQIDNCPNQTSEMPTLSHTNRKTQTIKFKTQTQNTKHKTQNTKHKTQNTKHKTQNKKHHKYHKHHTSIITGCSELRPLLARVLLVDHRVLRRWVVVGVSTGPRLSRRVQLAIKWSSFGNEPSRVARSPKSKTPPEGKQQQHACSF
jgi:hypothetical protein